MGAEARCTVTVAGRSAEGKALLETDRLMFRSDDLRLDIPFDGIAFRGAPFGLRSGNTWALPLAGAWYKILDFLT